MVRFCYHPYYVVCSVDFEYGIALNIPGSQLILKTWKKLFTKCLFNTSLLYVAFYGSKLFFKY